MAAKADRLRAVPSPAPAQEAEGKEPFRDHPAMRQLLQRALRAYEGLAQGIFRAILRFIATDIVPGVKLEKSEGALLGFASEVSWPGARIALLTPAQLEVIRGIVRDYHYLFAAGLFGPDALPPADLARIQATGVTLDDVGAVLSLDSPLRLTDLAYRYGQHLAAPRQAEAVRQMGADAFRDHLRTTRSELSPVEQQAMAWARYNAGQYARGMGDRYSLQIGAHLLDADAELRREYLGTVQRELEDAVDQRETWRKLASEVGHATEDWGRDLQRLAATEMQWAMQEGQASVMARGRDARNIRVAKQPTPDACDDCVRLHLTAGRGSPPKIFTLAELMRNGTNVGVKRVAYRPTIGPVHPWCQCVLIEVPDGWAFDEDGQMVPEIAIRKGDRLAWSAEILSKGEGVRSFMTFGDAVPVEGLVVRVSDPQQRAVVEAVVKEAPPEIFRKDVGVTLITTDHPREQNPLEDHDFAYWTGNEIRVNGALPIERWPRVLRHELGHSLNVYLLRTLGSTEAVRKWHDDLWEVSGREGFVSDYAKKLPIENAAEVTRMYLFERPRLMLRHPQQFARAHAAYRGIFVKR